MSGSQIRSSGRLACWQRSVVMALPPATVRCMPDSLRRWPVILFATGSGCSGAGEQAAGAEPVTGACGARCSRGSPEPCPARLLDSFERVDAGGGADAADAAVVQVLEAGVLSLAVPPGGLLRGHGHAGAVDCRVGLVRQRGRRERHERAGGDQHGPVPDGGRRGAAGLSGTAARLTARRTPARFSSSRAAFANGPAAATWSFLARSPGDKDASSTPGSASPGGQPVLAGGAVIPGTREGDRPGHRAGDLVPAGRDPAS